MFVAIFTVEPKANLLFFLLSSRETQASWQSCAYKHNVMDDHEYMLQAVNWNCGAAITCVCMNAYLRRFVQRCMWLINTLHNSLLIHTISGCFYVARARKSYFLVQKKHHLRPVSGKRGLNENKYTKTASSFNERNNVIQCWYVGVHWEACISCLRVKLIYCWCKRYGLVWE